jgi:hypothetical protein
LTSHIGAPWTYVLLRTALYYSRPSSLFFFFFRTNVASNNPMIIFASDNPFGLIYVGQRGPERNLSLKGLPQQAEVAQGVPGRLRPRIFLKFATTRVVGRQPYVLGRLYPSRNPWYSFLEAESTPGHMVPSIAMEKNPSDTTGNRSRDRPTSSAVP